MRDYDPTLARYLSVDPLGTGGGRNKFSYAGANPQNLVDPSGQYIGAFLAGAAVGLALDYALARLEHYLSGDCQPFSYSAERAIFAATFGGLFGIAPRLLGIGLRALGGAAANLASRAAPTLSGQTPGLLRRFLASESGAFAPGALAAGARAEAALLREFGGMPNVFLRTPLGGRFVDSLAGGVAREAKSGYVTLSARVEAQIAKDAALRQSALVRDVEWVFYRSSLTGRIGPSRGVETLLRSNNIGIVYRGAP
jgi:hypothetical protein